MKRTVAIIAGGDSSEHEVSMNSAKGIYSFIDKEKYNLYIVELSKKAWEAVLADGTRSKIDKNDFSFMDGDKKVKPDFAYITIHGTPGENGILQGYFELLDIPYLRCPGFCHDFQQVYIEPISERIRHQSCGVYAGKQTFRHRG